MGRKANAGGRASGRPGPTAQVISLRRRAESEAQAALRAARVTVEQARIEAARLRLQVVEAEQSLLRARSSAQAPSGPQPAGDLLRQAAALKRRVDELRHFRQAAAAAASAFLAEQQQLERWRADWLACVARREAAELHEDLERREQRRVRREREALHDDEARQRFASAARLPNR